MFDFFMFYMWLTLFFVIVAVTGFVLSVFSYEEIEDTNKSAKESSKKARRKSR